MSLRISILTKGLQPSDPLPTLQLDPVEGIVHPIISAVRDLPANDVDQWRFELADDTPRWGFSVRWGRRGEQWAHSALPTTGTSWQGSQLPLDPLPAVLDYGPAVELLAIEGDHFVTAADRARWWWRGISDFRLLELVLGGVDIAARLQQRLEVGANLVRVLSMKTNNTGWALNPGQANYWDAMQQLFALTSAAGLYVELTVFADTRAVMPDPAEQQEHWGIACARASMYGGSVFLELLNEANHPTQRIDLRSFGKPSSLNLCSHGSGLTDTDVVRPLWDYATYHARRMAHGADARGFTNYSPYAFQENWPKACPFIADEGEKPSAYGFNPEYARLMGLSARSGAGATFHWGGGIGSDLLPDADAACARAFFSELMP